MSFSYLPASTFDVAPGSRGCARSLTADQADFPTFSSTTPLDGNMAYGAAWGVAFVEYLKDAGRNFTRASFLKTMEKHDADPDAVAGAAALHVQQPPGTQWWLPGHRDELERHASPRRQDLRDRLDAERRREHRDEAQLGDSFLAEVDALA